MWDNTRNSFQRVRRLVDRGRDQNVCSGGELSLVAHAEESWMAVAIDGVEDVRVGVEEGEFLSVGGPTRVRPSDMVTQA